VPADPALYTKTMADTGPDKLWTLSPAIDLGKKTLIQRGVFDAVTQTLDSSIVILI